MVSRQNITVQYFALLREERGLSEEVLETVATTADALFDELQHLHTFSAPKSTLSVVLNHQLADWQAPLKAQDIVAFLPPYSRG